MPEQVPKDRQTELANHLADQVISIRNRRRWIEENWLRGHRVWQSLGIERRYMSSDTSKNDYDIPVARRAIERSIVRAIKLLTPNVKWHEVQAIGNVSDDQLSNMDNFMHYVLRKQIRAKSNISQLVRCMFLYGRCHLKTSIALKNGKVWPSQRAVDPYSYYVFPETATTPDDELLHIEDFMLSYETYKARSRKGLVEDIKPSDLSKPDWPYHYIERLSHQGITDIGQDVSIQRDELKKTLDVVGSSFVALTEVWLPKEDSLYQVYIAWNVKKGPKIVGFIKSPYDEPLYRTAIHRAVPGEMYTNSTMDDIIALQDLSNDQLNQFLDASDWEQGFVGVNDNEVSRMDSIKVKGRSIFHFKDDPRTAMSMLQPNISSTNQLRSWQITLGLVNSLASAGTIAEGQPGRNMPRAGGAVNNLVSLALADVQDVSELIEQDVLSPSLGDIYKVSAEFIPEEQLIKIPGGVGLSGAVLKREQIVGDYEFEWVGSLQFQDEQARAQRLMIFLNLAIQPQASQLLAQQGYGFNFSELLQTVWRYGLGERGLQKVIVPLQELQQIIQQEAQQGANGAANGSPSGNGIQGLNYKLPAVTSGFVKKAAQGF